MEKPEDSSLAGVLECQRALNAAQQHLHWLEGEVAKHRVPQDAPPVRRSEGADFRDRFEATVDLMHHARDVLQSRRDVMHRHQAREHAACKQH